MSAFVVVRTELFDSFVAENDLQILPDLKAVKEAAKNLEGGVPYAVIEHVGGLAPKVAVKLNFNSLRTRAPRKPRDPNAPPPAKRGPKGKKDKAQAQA